MTMKAKQNIKELRDRNDKFRKRKRQSSSEDVRPRKNMSEGDTSGFRPSRFGGRLERKPLGDAFGRSSARPQYISRSMLGRSKGP